LAPENLCELLAPICLGVSAAQKMTEKPRLIIPRSDPEPHYELHFDDHVDFVTLDGKLLLRSKVEPYP
jgi:hypothetical protein